jgi:pimeloyl-ACP methyl ester carboxylesterase
MSEGAHMEQSFSINVPQAALDDLHLRLQRTRWLIAPVSGWADGTSYDYLRELVRYWETQFDWRAQERRLNALNQFCIDVSGAKVHGFHLRSGRPEAIPLLLCHGWPGGINEFEKLAQMLLDPNSEIAFDLVIPSMPGFGFSDPRAGAGVGFIADLWGELMRLLGYERFAVQGGDWGAWVGIAMSRRLPHRVLGVHLNYVPARYLPPPSPQGATAEEREYLERRQRWNDQEGAYTAIQGTKPQSLGFGLCDSPAGLAAWIIEKFQSWSDCGGDVESVFSKDELLTNVSLYWFTNSMYTAMRIYKEARRDVAETSWSDGPSPVPIAIAHFPKEIPFPPRGYLSKFLNIARWTEMPRGGHFAALECPRELAKEIQSAIGAIVFA